MIKRQSIDNQLDDDIYSKVNPFNWKFIVIGFFLLIMGFLVNFPIRKTIIGYASAKLGSNRSCPMTFERLDLGNFLQWAKFTGPIFSGRCYGQSSMSMLRLESLGLALVAPSVNPPGLKLHIEIKKGKTNLNIYPTISYPKMGLEIKNSVIDGNLLKNLTGDIFKIHGQIKIDSHLIMTKKNLTGGKINITSKNLSIPPQNIMNFLIPYMNLEELTIKGSVKGRNTLHFTTLKLGSKISPIIANLKGSIKINPTNTRASTLDLKGKIKFTPEFIKKFAILNLFLAGKNKDPEGFYNLSIKGPMGRPKMGLE